MKTGLSLVDLAQKIQSEQTDRNDYMVDTRSIHVTNDTLVLNPNEREAQAFGITEHTHGQIATYTGIPKRYYDRMRQEAPDLLSSNVEEWFDQNPKRRMVRTIGDSARAFLSDRYRPLDNFELADAVLPILAEKGVDIISAQVTETKMYIKVIDPKLKGRVDWGAGHQIGRATDDEIIWGATITNSEVGAGSLSVSTMTLSMWCSNLMIVGKEFSKYHVGRAIEDSGEFYKDETRLADDRATFLKLRDTVDHALTEVSMQETIDKYSAAAQNKITANPVKAVEKVAKVLRVTDEEQGSILQHLVEGGGLNQWALANAVTAVAEGTESYDRATELEAAGNRVINLTNAQWKEIAA